jgi:hypothetical protein
MRSSPALLLLLCLLPAACAAPGADAPPDGIAAAVAAHAPPDTTRWADALRSTACAEGGDTAFAPERVTIHPLEAGVELVEVLCEMAAYQGIYAYLLRDTRGAAASVTHLRFPWVRTDDGVAGQATEVGELVGTPRYDAARRELSIVTRYRGVGDCGEAATIRFAGTLPELVSFRAKPECDGRVVDAAGWPRVEPGAAPAPAADPHTPPPGSAERRAIFDALRADMQRRHGYILHFTARHLAVAGGWAWADVDPEDDAGGRYESVAALLRRGSEGWRVIEYLPGFGEREGTPLEDDCRWFQDLLRRRTSVPAAILPAAARPPCGP